MARRFTGAGAQPRLHHTAYPIRCLLISAVLVHGATAAPATPATPAAIAIDYPEAGSIFPPEITPPTFLWRDSAPTARAWHVDVSFADGSAAIHATSSGEHMRIGRIDPDCVADTNEPPKLTPQQAAAHSWIPDPAMWQAIKQHSVARRRHRHHHRIPRRNHGPGRLPRQVSPSALRKTPSARPSSIATFP